MSELFVALQKWPDVLLFILVMTEINSNFLFPVPEFVPLATMWMDQRCADCRRASPQIQIRRIFSGRRLMRILFHDDCILKTAKSDMC